MFKTRFISMLVLLAAVVTGARAQWTGGTYTATANEDLGAITVNGDATLTINSDVTVTVTGGINVASGTLTVTGPGTLVVTGSNGSNGTGVGSVDTQGGTGGTGGVAISGNIIVQGGATVTATGGNGGTGGNGDNYGGTGGTGGVAISGNIIVQGGATVTANGGNGGTGGNGGWYGGKGGNGGNAFAGTLTYKSGTVTANGGSGGSGAWSPDEGAYRPSGSAGKAFANDVDFTQTTGYSVTNGTSTIGSVLNQTKVVISGGTPIPTGYSVSLKSGTDDATSWQGKAGEGEYQELPLTGLEAGAAVSVKYSGTKKVKSVKAKKAAAAYAANEYNEASWDGTKVTFTKQTATSVTAVANSDAAVTWSDGWYTVSGNVTITGNVTLGADAHLILQDGATLTINGQLNCNANKKNLYIYGQKKGDGKLNVTNNGAHAINSNMNYRIDIHGGEVTAAATGDKRIGLSTGYLAVYGGKLTATSGGGSGINFQNTFDVYGGEVEATSNATSSSNDHCGIRSGGGTSSQILTVYGGKVTATGNGVTNSSLYGSGIRCYVKSGTSGIKFYFSEDGNTWDEGTSYASATSVGRPDDDAATIKRYAKAE